MCIRRRWLRSQEVPPNLLRPFRWRRQHPAPDPRSYLFMLLSVVVRTKRWREKRIGNFMAVEKFGLFSLFWSPRFWCCRSFFAHFWKEIGWEYDLRNKPCIYGLHIHASHTSYLCIHKYFPIFHCCQKAPITELSIILIVVWFHSKSMFSPFTHTHKFLWCGFLPGTNFTNWSLPNSLIGWVLVCWILW